jgi:PBP1b-binding outer membrane lipoprotein LpoB
MKKSFIAAAFSLLLLSGCVSSVVKSSIEQNAARADAYVEKMDAGETTREQDQKFIYVIRIMNHSLNWNVNDVEPPPDVKLILEQLGLTSEGE